MSEVINFPVQNQGTVVFQIFRCPMPWFYTTVLHWPDKPPTKPQLTNPEEIPLLVSELADCDEQPLEFEVHDFSTELEHCPAYNDNRPPEHY